MKLRTLVTLVGIGIAVGVFTNTHPNWTTLQLIKFLVALIAGIVIGVFINSQILLPILYNLPKSIYLYFRGELRFAGILAQFVAPVSWAAALLIIGLVVPPVADFVSTSIGFTFGEVISVIVVLLSVVTPTGLRELGLDYEEGTYSRFGKAKPFEDEMTPEEEDGHIFTSEHDTNLNNNSDARLLIDRGIVRANSKDYHGALQDFDKAIELEPTSAEAYFERSNVKRELKDELGANQDLRDAKTRLDKSDEGLEAYDSAGGYYDAGDYKNAIRHYNKAIALLPSLTDVFYNRGIAKQLLADYKGAVEDFDRAIQANASNKADAYYRRGQIKYHKLKDADGALQDYNKAIELKPTDADLYYSRSMLLDDYDALLDLNRAIELSPSNARIYFARSLKQSAMEDYEGAICGLSRFIDLAPSDADLSLSEAYSLRASMKVCLFEFESALQDQNKAIDLDLLTQKRFLAEAP